MRLKAKIHDSALFLKLIMMVQKINSTTIMMVDSTKIRFIVINDITDGFQVWSGINQSSLFTEFDFDSASNIIALEIDLEKLVKALKSGIQAHHVMLKLCKKESTAYLSFTIDVNQSQSLTIQHDIPIKLMSSNKLNALHEPSLPNPDVYIILPSQKILHPMIEKMKNVDQNLLVSANMEGFLTLRVETDMYGITSFFNNLEHPKVVGEPTKNKLVTVRVDIRKFYKSLHSYQVTSGNLMCFLFEKQALVLHALVGDLFVTYYIPVILNES